MTLVINRAEDGIMLVIDILAAITADIADINTIADTILIVRGGIIGTTDGGRGIGTSL